MSCQQQVPSSTKGRFARFATTARPMLVCLLILFLIVGFGVHTSASLPNRAIMVVDDAARIYYAPPYFEQHGKRKPVGAREVSYGEIKGQGYKPDFECREGEYFIDRRDRSF